MSHVQIGERIRELRTEKKMSQGDIERRTGLLRCYTSRVEHGITVPSIETLEKYAHAMQVPLYRFFYNGDKPKKLNLPAGQGEGHDWGNKGSDRRELQLFVKALSRMDERQLKLIIQMAEQMARAKQE